MTGRCSRQGGGGSECGAISSTCREPQGTREVLPPVSAILQSVKFSIPPADSRPKSASFSEKIIFSPLVLQQNKTAPQQPSHQDWAG